MSRPLWARWWFAAGTALALLVIAGVALWRAALYARMNAPMAERLHPDLRRAVILMILSMLLVVGAIVLPLVMRTRGEKRLQKS